MTTASKITMLRIAMIPFFIACALIEFSGHLYVALAIFIVAAATDSVDGYVARHYNQVSDFGKFVDPLADKLLVMAALLIFVAKGQMASWACFIVITRELAVQGLRLVAVEQGKVIAAAMSGKVKTLVTMVCICVMFLPLHDSIIFSGLSVDLLCVILILAVTVYSGIEYFYVNRNVFNFED